MVTTKANKADSGKGAGNIFLVSGTDEFEVSRRAKHVAGELCPEAERAFGLEVVEAACDTVEESLKAIRSCLAGLQTVGFFGAAKLVWLRDASFLHDSRPGKSAEVKAAVGELAEEVKRGLLPGVRLLVSATQIDKRTAFYKALEKTAVMQWYDLPDKSYKLDGHAEAALRGLLEDAGLRANADVIRFIVARAGYHARQLAQEVEKLSLYLGERKQITEADVFAIVSPAREHVYGELADMFARRDLPGALRIARQLVYQKEQPVGLMFGLQSRAHDLLVYQTALSRRWARLTGSEDWPKMEWVDDPEADSFFSSLPADPRTANPYWAGILGKQASRFTVGELKSAQRALVEAHGAMTAGTAPDDFMLEWALIKAMGGLRDRKN